MFYDEYDEQRFVEEKLREIWPNTRSVGDTIRGRCPICGDSRKSVSKMRGNYYKRTNSYNCFNEGCTAKGLWIIAKFEDRDIADVRQEFFSTLKISSKQINKSVKPKITQKPESTPQPTNISIASSWFPLEGDNLLTIRKRKVLNAIGSPKNWKLFFDTTTKRIVIPWYNYTNIEYYQLRATKSSQVNKYIYPKNIEKPIFNLDKINEDIPFIFMTEGAFDAVFVPNGVAIGTTQLTSHQEQLLENYPFHERIYILDNQNVDTTAYNKLLKCSSTNPSQRCFVWPKYIQNKDINDYIIKYNVNIFSNIDFILNNSFKGGALLARLKFNI